MPEKIYHGFHVWKRNFLGVLDLSTLAHADVLYGLEQFALGLDAGGEDDLGFLKFTDAGGADVAHAGGDRADQILRTVVHRRRSEENLFQRTGDTHFDARAAGQIGVRGGHAPVVPLPRRLLRAGEGAADHDRVRTAGQGLADVAA